MTADVRATEPVELRLPGWLRSELALEAWYTRTSVSQVITRLVAAHVKTPAHREIVMAGMEPRKDTHADHV